MAPVDQLNETPRVRDVSVFFFRNGCHRVTSVATLMASPSEALRLLPEKSVAPGGVGRRQGRGLVAAGLRALLRGAVGAAAAAGAGHGLGGGSHSGGRARGHRPAEEACGCCFGLGGGGRWNLLFF